MCQPKGSSKDGIWIRKALGVTLGSTIHPPLHDLEQVVP